MTQAVQHREPWSSLAVRTLGRAPLNLLLVGIALFWLLPTFGLLIASLRSAGDNSSSGWWNALGDTAQLSFENYRKLFDNADIIDSFWNTVLITVPTTLLVVFIGAMALQRSALGS